MNKEECIARYGEEACQKLLEQRRIYHKEHKEQENARSKRYRKEHPEEVKAYSKKYKEEHPEQVIANNQESCRKGGKYYETKSEYKRTGLQGKKNKIRRKHAKQYKPCKQIIAPDSQLHHEWIPKTAEYKGVALVEADAHMHGFVDVIEILAGKITLLTEEEVKKGKSKMKEEEQTCENCYYHIYKDDCPVPFEMQGQLSSKGSFFCPYWTQKDSLSNMLKCFEELQK